MFLAFQTRPAVRRLFFGAFVDRSVFVRLSGL